MEGYPSQALVFCRDDRVIAVSYVKGSELDIAHQIPLVCPKGGFGSMALVPASDAPNVGDHYLISGGELVEVEEPELEIPAGVFLSPQVGHA